MATFAKSLRLPSLDPPSFDMSRLMLATILSALDAVRLACSLKVSLLSNHTPKYFRAVQSLICFPFRWKEGGTEPTTACKQHRFRLRSC